MTFDCGPFQSVSAALVSLPEGNQSLSDKLVLLQQLGDVLKNSKLGLSRKKTKKNVTEECGRLHGCRGYYIRILYCALLLDIKLNQVKVNLVKPLL